MQVTRIATLSDIPGGAAVWNRLARDVPLRGWDWLDSWWRHYGLPDQAAPRTRRELYTLVVHDSERVAGVAPWYVERTRAGRWIVRFLGSGEVCSDYPTLLCAPGDENAVAYAVAEWLCRRSRSSGDTRERRAAHRNDRWDVLDLAAVDAADTAIARLVERLTAHGCPVHQRPGPNCWRVELPASWAEHLRRLSKNRRKQVRQIQHRMFETGRAVHREVATPDELAQGMGILIDLHQRRQQSLGEPGCFSSARFTAFHKEVTSRLLAAGALRLSWVELDGRPVAAEYQIAGGGVVYVYQSGVEPAALEEEPGHMVTAATLKRAIECGQRAFDFLRGDEPYKAHWKAEPRPTRDIRIVRPGASARLAHGVWVAGQNVKAWIKGGLQRTASRTAGSQ